MIKIAITDDHQMVIEGLKHLLSTIPDIEVVETYNTIEQTRAGLPRATPDILFLDINLPDGNGSVSCSEFLRLSPNTHIIALTNIEDSAFIKQMLRNGAMGYLMKNTDKEEIELAIHEVMNGDVFLSEKLKKELLNESLGGGKTNFIPKLTRREKEVLNLIMKEYTNSEIADSIFVSIKTVESHRASLLQKIGARNTAGLVRIAIEKGLI